MRPGPLAAAAVGVCLVATLEAGQGTCTLYDFARPDPTAVGHAATMLAWIGGTKEECEKLRGQVESYLKQRVADAEKDRNDANKVVTDSIRNISQSGGMSGYESAKKRASAAEARVTKVTADVAALGPCQCTSRTSTNPSRGDKDRESGSTSNRTSREPSIRSGGDQRTAKMYPRSTNRSSRRRSEEDEERARALEALLPGINKSTELGYELIENRRYQARRLLSGATLQRYMINADNVESALRGANKLLTGAEYVHLLTEIGQSDGTERSRRIGEFVQKGAEDLASAGFETFGPRLLGASAMAIVRAVSAGASILLSSEDISREPAEIIRDRNTSLREKQAAVGVLWRQFDRYGRSWGEGQIRELEELSGIVYGQAVRVDRP